MAAMQSTYSHKDLAIKDVKTGVGGEGFFLTVSLGTVSLNKRYENYNYTNLTLSFITILYYKTLEIRK